jgi:membrane-associated phospholipid phosphatase
MNNNQTIRWPSLELIIRWVVGAGIVFVIAATFTDLAEDVWFREGFAWDAPIILAIHQASSPWLDAVMKAITWSGETGAVLTVIVVSVWLLWKRRPVDAAALLIVFGSAVVLNTIMKVLFARARPALFTPLAVESSFSFPSGHVTAATAVYGFLAVLLWQGRQRVLAILCGLWVLAVASSRVYLGVHYPSDTLAAFLFTTLLLVVVFSLRDRYLRREKPDSTGSPGPGSEIP